MEAFEAYGMFLAMRAHFNQKGYSFVKYNGKIRTSYEKFLQRNDRHFFHRLSKKGEPQDYVLANLLENPSAWITDILDPECDDVYREWRKRHESLSYVFETELRHLDDDFNENFKVIDGQHPKLLELYLEGRVSHESMVILNELTGAFPKWNSKINDPVVWPMIFEKLRKYRELLPIADRKESFRKRILDRFTV